MQRPFDIYLAFAVIFWLSVVSMIAPSVRKKMVEWLTFPASTTQKHVAGFDALRGLAALHVAIFHTWQWTRPALDGVANIVPFLQRGEKAVPVFVILSGCLIYRSLQRVESLEGLRRYLDRRFFRIFPVYAATILACSLLLWHQSTDLHIPPLQYFVAGIFMLRTLGFPVFANPQSWSLFVEVLFYLILPMFVLATRGSRSLLWAICALCVFALSDALGPRELGLWKYFCFGLIAAELISRCKSTTRFDGLVLGLIGLGIVIADEWTNFDWLSLAINSAGKGYVYVYGGFNMYTLTIGVGMTLLLVGVANSRELQFVLESFPLRMLGAISYSLFMWHSVLIAVGLPINFDGVGYPQRAGEIAPISAAYFMWVMLPGMIAAAAASFLLIERPFLLRRRRQEPGRSGRDALA